MNKHNDALISAYFRSWDGGFAGWANPSRPVLKELLSELRAGRLVTVANDIAACVNERNEVGKAGSTAAAVEPADAVAFLETRRAQLIAALIEELEMGGEAPEESK